MGFQPLGEEHYFQRSRVVLDLIPPTDTEVLPRGDPPPERICTRPPIKGGDKESKIPEVPRPPVLCPQEGLGQKEGDPRPIGAKQVHQVRTVPNAICFTGTDPTTPRGCHHLNRPHRRLLARPDCTPLYPLPWLQTGKSGIHLQDLTLRAQHSSKDLHQDSRHNSPSPQTSRGPGSSLPGRLVNLGHNGGKMPPISKEGHVTITNPGVSNQPSEIPPKTSQPLRMARPRLGPNLPYPLYPPIQEETNCQTDETVYQSPDLIKKVPREGSRLPSVRVHHRLGAEDKTKGYKQGMAQKGIPKTERHTLQNSTYSQIKASSVDHSQEPLQDHSPPLPTSVGSDPHRRISDWLGWPGTWQKMSGNMVPCPPKSPHKRVGSDGSLPDIKEIQTQATCSCQNCPGQPSNSSLPEQTGIEIKTNQPRDDCNFLVGRKKSLAPLGSTPGGGQECDSGLIVSPGSSGVGVVTRRPFVSVDIQTTSGSPGGSVCDGGQPQATLLCSSEPGPSGLCDGRPIPGMESVGQDLPFSPNQPPPESSPQVENIQREGSTGSPRLAEKQLVSNPPGTPPPPHPHSPTEVVPNSANQDCISFILAHEHTNFMGFLRFAAKRRFNIDPANVDFTEADKSQSTIRQYDSAFRRLSKFIHKERPREMSANLTISFFRSLHEEGLAPSTVTTAKSALAKIFYYGFDIRLDDPRFTSIPRSCAKLRPAERPEILPWSLNKVLKLASEIDNDTCSYQELLRKALFLVSLASGARLSELEALSRDEGFIKFLPSGEASLSPHLKFLAKNEDPQHRWKPWKIIPLPQDPSLCPVTVLRSYLSRTSPWTSGRLFRREKGGTITTKGIRQQILYLIKEADPQSVPKAHQVRALATSLNFFHFMDFHSLTQYTGWKSVGVFLRHYFRRIDTLRFHTVAAGKVVPPASNTSDLEEELDI